MALVNVAEATGVNIVMGAGYYVDMVHPSDMDDRSEEHLASQIIEELTVGVGVNGSSSGHNRRVGLLVAANPEMNGRCCERALGPRRRPAAAILIHPGRNPRAPFKILDILEEAGADISRVIMGHLDRTILDTATLLEFADRGAMLEYDLFGWESSYYSLGDHDMIHDGQRLDYVEMLIDDGHLDKIVLAQDVFSKARTSTYGGYGYGHLIENIVPRMRDRGISEEHVRRIMIENPARILTFE